MHCNNIPGGGGRGGGCVVRSVIHLGRERRLSEVFKKKRKKKKTKERDKQGRKKKNEKE